ncbi:peptidoglycan-binding protein [Streptomyces sp. LBUM 1485]|nr:peptidoglycan-binding protein [Streptomyces sp. LBUM 1485]
MRGRPLASGKALVGPCPGDRWPWPRRPPSWWHVPWRPWWPHAPGSRRRSRRAGQEHERPDVHVLRTDVPLLLHGARRPSVRRAQHDPGRRVRRRNHRRSGRGGAVPGQEARLRPEGIDASFGPNTKAAVQRFQRSRGLEDDGIVGPMTWRELRKPSG